MNDLRGILFTDAHTGRDWGIVLTSKNIPRATVKENFVEVEGGDTDLDYTEAFGDVKYRNRMLEFTFSISDGTYLEREALIAEITQYIHGKRHMIMTDDDPMHYFSGRCKIESVSNGIAYGLMKVSVNADPWCYSINKTVITLTTVAGADPVECVLANSGRMVCIPEVAVNGNISLTFDDTATTLSTGSYILPGLKLRTGYKHITVSGNGTIRFEYREAIL